jgi:type I restriction enzyme, S subunit
MTVDNQKLNIEKSDWQLVRLGELANEISKRIDDPARSEYKKFVGLEHFASGDLKIKSWGTVENLASSMKAFECNDVLFARRNAYLRRASLVKFDGVCSGDAFVLRENAQKLVPGFLAFIVNSNKLWDYANSNAAGTMSKRVKWRDLAEYRVLLPPKDQQSKISDLFWAINICIEKELVSLKQLELLRDVNREKLFTYGVKVLNGKSPINVKKTKAGLVRSDIEVRKFFDCVEIKSGQVDPKKEEYANLVQIGAERIEPNTGRITELKTAKELNITSGNYLFTDDDIIYSKIRPYFKKVANPGFTGLCSADIYPLRPKGNN